MFYHSNIGLGLGLWYLTPLFQLYFGGQFYRPAVSQGQTLSHNILSSTPHLGEIRTHNVSGDRHRLHR
jgi:hypothetical protein